MKYNGLTEEQVVQNRNKYGSNKLSEIKKESLIQMFISSLGDPIIKILLIALGIKIILFLDNFDWHETIGIMIAIFIASLISTISEYGSEKAFAKLVEEASKLRCKVIRNKQKKEILIEDVVKDDIINLEAGDKVPADGIIIDGTILVDESTINGESLEKEKELNAYVYRGTVVVTGSALMKVVNVGLNTTYGKLAAELKIKKVETPLKIRLAYLANQISKIGYILAILVALAYLFSTLVINNNFNFDLIIADITNFPYLLGQILYSLTLAVTVIIVSVPEGLPMMITLVLSSNMKKMIHSNVLIRKMNGIETAGNINLLFTDKTGTITTGAFKVMSVINGELKEYQNYQEIKNNYAYNKIIIKSLGNNNKCIFNEQIIGGNLTDRALFEFIEHQKEKILIKEQKEFDSKNKYSSILTNNELLIKGASEKILDKCTKYYNEKGEVKTLFNKHKLKEKMNLLARNGSRLIACAIKENALTSEDFNNLILVCIINIKDEVKPHTKEVVDEIRKAGVNTIMITGDNKDTAYSIGKTIGLINEEKEIITTTELNNYTDEELFANLENIKIIARALPSDKSRLVKIAQKKGYVVGMTGDGVNDAPALKLADVGFAMGSGVEIAKEASDIVILDNNLKSIGTSILYGRTTFKNIRKFIMFQLTINICAIALSVICPFIGIEMPVTVMQMLWINMIMDTLAGLAFSFEPPRISYMHEMPLKKEEKIISNYMKNQIAFGAIYISIILFAFLKIPFVKTIFPTSETLMTGFFATLIFISIFNAFNIRTHRLNILADLNKNKLFLMIIAFIVLVQIIIIYYGGDLFRTVSINCQQLAFVLLISFSIIPADLIRKFILKLKNKNVGV